MGARWKLANSAVFPPGASLLKRRERFALNNGDPATILRQARQETRPAAAHPGFP
jgi:hypothetical protein